MPANITISPNNTPYLVNPCTFYFVQLSSDGSPIPSTMFSKHTNNLSDGQTSCTEARVTPYQTQPKAGYQPCLFKSGLRYFYQINRNQQIVPNSMIAVKNRPMNLCSGTHTWLEFRKYY